LTDFLGLEGDDEDLNAYYSYMNSSFKVITKSGLSSIRSNNGVWIQTGYQILPAYRHHLRRIHGIDPISVDFSRKDEVVKQINSWVSETTSGKIVQIVDRARLPDPTRMVFVNTVNFKGKWLHAFKTHHADSINFYPSREDTIRVAAMAQTEEYEYWTSDSLSMVRIPMKGNHLNMLIILPEDIDGLADFEKKLNLQTLRSWEKKLVKTEVSVMLPKFSMTTGASVRSCLEELGIVELFDLNKADLSGITGRKDPLFIGDIQHVASIAVDEQGVEAVAATGVVGIGYCPPFFSANHPFFFLIEEASTKTIIFIGRFVGGA